MLEKTCDKTSKIELTYSYFYYISGGITVYSEILELHDKIAFDFVMSSEF